VYAGIHYRSAVESAAAMGHRIGELAARQMGMAKASSARASR
jgi:hypothetical protein